MATYRAPGVYIEEVPGARSISGVSTDVATFVGVTEIGKKNLPTLITSWSEYETKFGRFMFNRYVPTAVYNFFAEGGARCYVVSTGMDSNFKQASAEADDYTQTAPGTMTFKASSAGAWANTLRIGINTDPKEEPNKPVSFSVQVLQYPYETFDSLSLSDVMIDRYIISNKIGPAGPSLYADSFYTSSLSAHAAVLEEFNGFTFDDLLGDKENPSNLMRRINASSLFMRVETSSFGGAGPSYTASQMKLPTRQIQKLAGGAGNPSQLLWMDGLNTLDPILDFSTIALPDCVDQSSYKLEKAPATSTYVETWRWADLIMKDGSGTKNSTRDLLGKCETWQRVFAVTDPPYGMDPAGMKNYKTGSSTGNIQVGQPLNSTYGAIYYPWTNVTNPYTSKLMWIPPSGQTLGRYSATDRKIGVWKAAAGVEDGKLLTARGIATEVTQVQQELLNPNGVDAIKPVPGYGICIYGARTVSLNSEWRYVPVRRLAIYIEQSLYYALQWVVFEPNSPSLWGRVSRDVNAFMNNLWRQGALFGTSAPEAYYVVCDASNNPAATRDEGYLYIDIGFAPVKPAEFVVIRLSQITLTA